MMDVESLHPLKNNLLISEYLPIKSIRDFLLYKYVNQNMSDEKRISIDPEICHGKPCIKGTRIPVSLILEMIEYGLSFKEILEEYSHISVEDIKACSIFAK